MSTNPTALGRESHCPVCHTNHDNRSLCGGMMTPCVPRCRPVTSSQTPTTQNREPENAAGQNRLEQSGKCAECCKHGVTWKRHCGWCLDLHSGQDDLDDVTLATDDWKCPHGLHGSDSGAF